jgi:hypothetical protein
MRAVAPVPLQWNNPGILSLFKETFCTSGWSTEWTKQFIKIFQGPTWIWEVIIFTIIH